MRSIYLITFFTGLVICLLPNITEGAGNFYVGLLGYNNTEGIHCCDNQTDESTCFDNCGLIFEVHVNGLNGTVHSKNLSDSVQLSLTEAITIPTSSVTNPLSFHFLGWPGLVNVTVVISAIYNGTVHKQFDLFEYAFEKGIPTDFYYISDIDSDVFGDSSRLTIVFRYRCNPLEGATCFGDCLEHNDTEPCPPTLPNPTSDIYTGFTDPACEGDTGNCSLNITTPTIGQTTATSIGSNETTDSVVTSNASLAATTQKLYQDTATSPPNSTVSSTSVTDPSEFNDTLATDTNKYETTQASVSAVSDQTTVNTSNDISTITTTTAAATTMTASKSTTKRSTKNTNSSMVTTDNEDLTSSTLPSKSTVRPTNPAGDVTIVSSTPDETSTKIDDDPIYWPWIVGGVLGGVALASAIGFCMYYRRQKKLRKRQEIYNVNPKVLRNFDNYEENGTSGRADLPLETEQY